MKFPKISKIKVPKVLVNLSTNKYVLYGVAFLSLFSLIRHVMMGHFNLAILFILIGYITHFFSRNMVVVLLVPLVLVSLSTYTGMMKEGFDTLTDQSTGNKLASDAGNPEEGDNSLVAEKDVDAEGKMEIPNPPIIPGQTPSTDGFEVGRKKGGQTSIAQPARIDYGSTIEKAYDDLNNVLGSEGIQRLTQDTQKLMKQQMELANAMKGMTPLLDQAQSMMKSLNMDKLDLNALAKQLGVNNAVAPPKNALIQKE
jgi:hypothetical protein